MRLHKSQTRWSIVAIMLFIGHISYGQEVSSDTLNKGWTLEQCIRYALENNLSIKSQNLSLKVQENTYTASQLGLLPSFTADASPSTTFGSTICSVSPRRLYSTSPTFSQFHPPIEDSITAFLDEGESRLSINS